MQIKRFLLLLLILSTGISCFSSKNDNKNTQFARIPVSFFPFLDRPTMKVEIEGTTYCLLIDSGSSSNIHLQTKFIEKIKRKESIGVSNYIGIWGTVHPARKFKIPEIKFQNTTVRNLVIYDDYRDLCEDSKIWPNFGLWEALKDALEFELVQGSIGWSVFKEADCFFDFPNSEILLAKDLSTLINQAGCSLEGFSIVPFTLDECGIALSIQTDLGVNSFMLDSGATHSVLRKSKLKNDQGQSSYITNQLVVGETNFGTWEFLSMEFSNEFKFDGILGVDFFKKHAICLDFHNKVAYIKRRQTVYERFTDWISKI